MEKRNVSPEIRAKFAEHARWMSKQNKGKNLTDEHKQRIASSRLGHEVSQETRDKISAAFKGEKNHNYGKPRDEETRRKIAAAHIGKHHSEETKAKIKAARAKQVITEETKEKMKAAHTGEKNHNYGIPMPEEQRIKISKSLSKENHPNYGLHHSGMSGKHHSEETKEKMRKAQLIIQNLPEVKLIKSIKNSGENNPNWNGGPKEYCHKFKNGTFRHRCRSFFNNTCMLCGIPANDNETLDVHHVYYNKKACCDISKDGKYYSDLGIKGNPKTFEIIGSPNKFVPLHHSCHSLTTPAKMRETYARLFESIINNKYGGRCYFTNREYTELGKD